jgi:hypothetical protein
LTAKHTVATPVNWRPGQDVIIPPAVNEQAAAKYPRLEDREALSAGRRAAYLTDTGRPRRDKRAALDAMWSIARYAARGFTTAA